MSISAGAPRGWDAFLTKRDMAVFERAGYGSAAGYGARPALLIVDATEEFCGPPGSHVLEAIQRSPLACGEEAWQAVEAIRRLLDVARVCDVPVFYSVMAPREQAPDADAWRRKRRTATFDLPAGTVVDPIAPRQGESVYEKRAPSVFHGTSLSTDLQECGVDSLIVCGGTTSGCVRATVTDAFSAGYRVVVPEECVFDRGQASHWISLFDMHQKYADVVPLDAALAALRSTMSKDTA